MTAPLWLSTEWDVDEFIPGAGLPILNNDYGTLISDQTVLTNVLISAARSNVKLILATSGPTIPPTIAPVDVLAVLAGANVTVDDSDPARPVVSATPGSGGTGTDPGAVRFDGVQSLVSGQKLQGRQNIGAMADDYVDAGAVRWDTVTTLTAPQQAQARANIGAAAPSGGGGGGGDMLGANNLSELTDPALARSHLQLPYFTRPEQYGAVADGVTNDSAAIQAAIDAAAANTLGGWVYLDETKSYAVATTLILKDGVHIVGGPDMARNTPGTTALGAKLIGKAAMATGYIIDTASSTTAIHNASVRGVTVSCIPMTTTGSTVYGGIRIQKGNYCRISGCVVFGASQPAINVANGVKNQVIDNTAAFDPSHRTLTTYEGAVVVGGTDNWVQNNQCNGGGSVGSPAVQYPSTFYRCGLLLNCVSSWIVGNNGEFADCGVIITGYWNTIVGLRGDVNAGRGVMLAGAFCSGNVLSNVLLIANSAAGAGLYDGLYIDSAAYGNSIDGISVTQEGTAVYLKSAVNDQSNPGTSIAKFPYYPNKVKRLKADWSMVANDIYQCANPYQAMSDPGAGFPQFCPPSRQLVGAMWYDTQINAPRFSDGANWRDAAGVIVGNMLTPVQSYFLGLALGATAAAGWATLNSTFLIVDGHAVFGRPNALRITVTSAGVTANLCGATLTAVAFKQGGALVPLFYARVQSGAAATAQVSVSWYTGAGTLISTSTPTTVACPSSTTPVLLLGARVLAPEQAASAVLNVQFTRAGGLVTGDAFEVDLIDLIPGNAATDHQEP